MLGNERRKSNLKKIAKYEINNAAKNSVRSGVLQ